MPCKFAHMKYFLYFCVAKPERAVAVVLINVKEMRTYWKRRLTRFVLAIWNLVNSLLSKTLRHEDAHGMYKRYTRLRVCVHTWWVSVLLVRIRRQYQSLR